MQYRKFGNTDLEVSEICFGHMHFSAKELAGLLIKGTLSRRYPSPSADGREW